MSRGFRVPTVLIVVSALGVGGLGGGLVQRHRHNQGELIVGVNGQAIDKETFFYRLQQSSGTSVMHRMVGEQLEFQFAMKLGKVPTDAEVDAFFAEASKRPGFQQELVQHGQSVEDYKQSIRMQLAKVKVLSKGVDVSDADVRKFYDSNVDPKNPTARYFRPENARVTVIVTSTDYAAQKALQDLYNGTPFAIAARTYSKDSSAAFGGEVPAFQRGRTNAVKIPGLEDAIFGLKAGQQLGPKQFGGDWWIVRCLDKKPAVKEPFDSVKLDCRTMVSLEKGLALNGKEAEKNYQEFIRQGNMQAFWPQYADVIKTK